VKVAFQREHLAFVDKGRFQTEEESLGEEKEATLGWQSSSIELMRSCLGHDFSENKDYCKDQAGTWEEVG
jgi:hypothetical protein